MKLLEEYRDPATVRLLADAVARIATKPWRLMEVCGGQTHSILENGIDSLLPDAITLVHGPGCPVCVTPARSIDTAAGIACRHEAVVCTFGDMLRVPGASTDLMTARSAGGDVRIVYSPMDALGMARSDPSREYVFFAVGFETTVPVTATAVLRARASGTGNFTVLNAHVRVPPALEWILAMPDCAVDGVLAAGHVCAVTGYEEYEPMAARHSTPIVVTGFEPVDILQGILMGISMLEAGEARVENQYARVVCREGNPAAMAMAREVFEHADADWRGLGVIPGGGWAFREGFRSFDAASRFGAVPDCPDPGDGVCMAAKVLTGVLEPTCCPAFGRDCTPGSPLGAPMVSSEGACAAYFRYRGGGR